MNEESQIENTNTANSDESRKSLPWLKPYQFKPGQSGNPSGRPKKDVAQEIAEAIFENNKEEIYKAHGKRLLKGDPKSWTALSERAYGKVEQKVKLSNDDDHPFRIQVEHVGSRHQDQVPTETK